MGIQVVQIEEEGKEYPVYGPMVLCSACGKQVTAKNGRYVWAISEGKEIITAYYHDGSDPAHVGCYGSSLEWEMRMKRRGYDVLWGNFDDFVSQLRHNLEIEKEEERMPKKMEASVHALLTIMRGFLYIDGDREKCRELVEEIHEAQLWLEGRKR